MDRHNTSRDRSRSPVRDRPHDSRSCGEYRAPEEYRGYEPYDRYGQHNTSRDTYRPHDTHTLRDINDAHGSYSIYQTYADPRNDARIPYAVPHASSYTMPYTQSYNIDAKRAFCIHEQCYFSNHTIQDSYDSLNCQMCIVCYENFRTKFETIDYILEVSSTRQGLKNVRFRHVNENLCQNLKCSAYGNYPELVCHLNRITTAYHKDVCSNCVIRLTKIYSLRRCACISTTKCWKMRIITVNPTADTGLFNLFGNKFCTTHTDPTRFRDTKAVTEPYQLHSAAQHEIRSEIRSKCDTSN
jgi:hypothetical protein